MTRVRLLLPLLVVLGCSQPVPRNLDELVQQGDLYLILESLEPYSGDVFRLSRNDSTKVRFRGTLRDGRLNGPYEDFDPDQDRIEERQVVYWVSGIDDGTGNYVERGTYENGRRVGSYELHILNRGFRCVFRPKWKADSGRSGRSISE